MDKFEKGDVVFINRSMHYNIFPYNIDVIVQLWGATNFVFVLNSHKVIIDNHLKFLGRGDHIDYINIV